MNPTRRSQLIYGLLFLVWILVVAWQAEEHVRVRDAAKADLRSHSNEIANTLSAVMRALRFRGGVLQQRLEPVLQELVNGRTNQLVQSSELIAVALLNTASEPVVSAGKPIDFSHTELLSEGEHWGVHTVTFVNPIEGARVTPDEGTNIPATVVIPGPPQDFTNAARGPDRDFFRREPPPGDEHSPRPQDFPPTNPPAGPGGPGRARGDFSPSGPPPEDAPRFRGNRDGDRRPPWLRDMDEKDFKALIQKHELHGLVLAMSTEKFRAICEDDLWLRYVIVFFAGISALGIGLARRSISKTSELQIRLIRASELNSHLREMNLAAAGLAHETRNPLNIIRGMAQMLSQAPDSTPDIHEKSVAIVNQTDRVTAQLNDFINYSRPREVRRARLSLASAVNEVVRTLGFDLEEKKITLEATGDPVFIEADEQLLRQVLFNLLHNAVQAVGVNGRIQVVTRRAGAAEVGLDICDDGAGVPPEHRQEIFKPYFTTNPKGTGLGLAVVQQIVLAHGWEIVCLPNEPKGARFRLSHLKVLA
jgi:signal transduction histidine kinase